MSDGTRRSPKPTPAAFRIRLSDAQLYNLEVMRWRSLLLIFVIAFTSGVICAIICPEDIFESHDSNCTQCISPAFVISAKSSDDFGAVPQALCLAWVELAHLSWLHETVDSPQAFATPRLHQTPILALRI